MAVYGRDGGACGICHLPIDKNATDLRNKFSIDHIIPITRGGQHTMANVQSAHFSCNATKSTKTMVELIALTRGGV